MRNFILFLALGASGFAGAANAQTAPGATPPPPPRGGPVTRADFIAQADARFVQMDTDHDGTVTPGEMRTYREAMRDRRIADGRDAPPPPPMMDAKRDGMRRGGPDGGRTMTRQDATDRAARRFDRMDTNHDGVLDPAERAAGRPMRGPRGDGAMPPAGAPVPEGD